MAGDEAGYPPGPFAEAYAIAAAGGLGCSVHAGEWAGPESVRAALDLPVTRLGHGVRAIEDPGLVAEIAERGIVLECCPTSNVVLGVFESFEAHPLPALRDAGVRVTLASDDPPYFGASVGGEYAVARERFGMSDADLLATTRTAIEASFAEPPLRAALLARLDDDDGRPT
jgi:adenosine deaminase